MYKILNRQDLAPNIHLLRIEAPKVAAKAQPGMFVMLRTDDKGERIPLTIADWDRKEGSITLVFNEVGITTRKLAALQVGDAIPTFVGPLGIPAHIERFGTVVCVVMGYGIASIVPVARALKETGNRVISVLRAPSKETLFGEERLRTFSDEMIAVTSDGSYGEPGFVLGPLHGIFTSQKVDRVFVIGPACVMKLVAAATRPFGIKTVASLNPIMVDGTGMCGCCRVIISGETKFACVDGPEFDAHEVDWQWLMARRCTYASDTEPFLRYRCQSCAQW